MELKEIALEAAVDYLKFKLGDREGFNVYDIDAYDADELIAEIEQECAKSFMEFLARVDQERGRDAVGYGLFIDGKCVSIGQHPSSGHVGGKSYRSQPLFLSPTIPAGYALVPNSALEWLNGEGEDFEQDRPGKFWWRSKFKELIKAAQEGVTK